MKVPQHIQEWIRVYAINQQWRVRPRMDEHDLEQEFYLVYRKCKKKTRARKLSQAHFSNYFKRSCFHFLTTAANMRTAAGEHPLSKARLDTTPAPIGGISTPLPELLEGFKTFVRSRIPSECADKGVRAVLRRLNGEKTSTMHLNRLISAVGAKQIKEFVTNY